jgi:phage terminase large subunit GpA-like protein
MEHTNPDGSHEITFKVTKTEDPELSFIVTQQRLLLVQVADQEYMISPQQARDLAAWLDSLYRGYFE